MGHVSEARAGFAGFRAKDADLAVRGPIETGNNPQQSRFTRAVFTAQDVEASGRQGKRDIAQGGRAAINLGNTLDLNGRGFGVQGYQYPFELAGAAGPEVVVVIPPCWGAYFDAHLAWISEA